MVLRELGALVDGPKNVVFLITAKYSKEFGRITYSEDETGKGAYSLGTDGARLNGSWATGCEIGPETVTVFFDTGHRVVFPRAWLQFTYVPA